MESKIRYKIIDNIVCNFQRCISHVVRNVQMCDNQTLCHLFSSNCESFHDCKIFSYVYNNIIMCPNYSPYLCAVVTTGSFRKDCH